MFINTDEISKNQKEKFLPKGHFGKNLFLSIIQGYHYADPINFPKGNFYFYIWHFFRDGVITDEIVKREFAPLYKNSYVANPNSSNEYKILQERWKAFLDNTYKNKKVEDNWKEIIDEKMLLPNLLVYKGESKLDYQMYIKKWYEDKSTLLGCNNLARQAWKIYTLLNISKEISLLSTCKGTAVGAILTDDDFSIISSGYNGVPSGEFKHCDLLECEEHDQSNELHAEANCIARSSIAQNTNHTMLFTTHLPCWECAKTIAASKKRLNIKKIFTRNIYSSTQPNSHTAEEVIGFLNKINIEVSILPTFNF